jgi:multidrug efflux pump subunit AcrA (membrane-fusion protein)
MTWTSGHPYLTNFQAMIGRTSEQVSSASQPEPDDDAVRRAKQEIQSLVQEVVDLSRSEIEESEFFAAMLDKAIAALAAIGGVVWTIEEGGPFKLQYQVNLQQTGLASTQAAQAQHAKLLGQIAKRGEPTLVAPRSGAGTDGEDGEDAAANPTDYLLVVAPIRTDRGVDGLVEVFQRTGARSTTQRGYLRFLVQICELAGEYLKTRRLRHFVTKQTLWEQLESFTSSVHTKLDSRQTAYTVANEGRRLIGCDRVTVVLRKGPKYVVEAISGQDTFDKRSNTVRMLRELATVVARSGEDLWYAGETENLAPQVEKSVNAYVDESHTKQIAVLPLREQDPHSDDKTKARKRENMLGALVIEQLVDSRPPDGMLQRVDVVRRHSATALTNAQAHESLFLLPLWRTIGKSRVLVTARNLPKTIAAALVIAALATFLSIYPWDFTVTADGKLLPEERRDVFAALNGMIINVPVRENQTVKRGDLLAEQRSSDLEQKIIALEGDLAENLKAFETAKTAQGTADPARGQDPLEIAGNLRRLEEEYLSLKRQERTLQEEHERLRITSPIDGKVVTWRVEQRLKDRTVNAGTRIMEIADPTTDWELQIDVPESKMGHVQRQRRAIKEKDPNAEPEVTFILATHVNPEDKLRGKVVNIDPSVEVGGETGNTVRMTVAFDQDELLKLIDDNSAGQGASVEAQANPEQAIAELKQNLKVGADVKAKIHCGREPVGYVLFHELWEFVQSRILFRF